MGDSEGHRWRAKGAVAVVRLGGLILAGGLGQRVGYKNKGLLMLNNRPLIEYLIANLAPQVDYLAISANQQLDLYQRYRLPVFTDLPQWHGLGPLAGIASAVPHFPQDLDAIQVVPCDTPLLPKDLVPRLTTALFAHENNQIAYAATRQATHPVIFLCKPAINKQLPAHIATQQLSLKSWIARHQHCAVIFDDVQAFSNVNHLDMLACLHKEI